MPAKSDPRAKAPESKYYYRRSPTVGTVLPALGVGVMAGLAAFYLTHLFLARKELAPRVRGG